MQGLYPQMAAVSPTLQPLQIQPMVAQPQSFGIMAHAQAFGMSPMQMLPQEYAQQVTRRPHCRRALLLCWRGASMTRRLSLCAADLPQQGPGQKAAKHGLPKD
jgi:hypothetical protein